jgi:hypothetical protein
MYQFSITCRFDWILLTRNDGVDDEFRYWLIFETSTWTPALRSNFQFVRNCVHGEGSTEDAVPPVNCIIPKPGGAIEEVPRYLFLHFVTL